MQNSEVPQWHKLIDKIKRHTTILVFPSSSSKVASRSGRNPITTVLGFIYFDWCKTPQPTQHSMQSYPKSYLPIS